MDVSVGVEARGGGGGDSTQDLHGCINGSSTMFLSDRYNPLAHIGLGDPPGMAPRCVWDYSNLRLATFMRPSNARY
jgi:hypothetical protein